MEPCLYNARKFLKQRSKPIIAHCKKSLRMQRKNEKIGKRSWRTNGKVSSISGYRIESVLFNAVNP